MSHYRHGRDRSDHGEGLAEGMGWFSIGLGVMELVAAESLARTLGMEKHAGLIRAFGAREVATGVAALAGSDPEPAIWARIGGDALDLAVLAGALHPDNPKRENVGFAIAAVAGATVLDVICAKMLRDREPEPVFDYSDRSGLPRPPVEMRGIGTRPPAPVGVPATR
ncbi:cyclase dehydrase [Faunimonas sp. B44]|uniref:cyclase dehydrase n=1 Tax=Faunimonas sp. B44 TaxID=3461493 RepID=UPI004043F298